MWAGAAERSAAGFAALGDPTRLALVTTLADGRPRSVTELTRGSALTRQAVRKHLSVLEDAGLVAGRRRGRETRFELEPLRLTELRAYLEAVGRQWQDALARLKAFAEE